MSWLFAGRVARVLNHNFLKLGSKAFYVNQVYLSEHADERSQKLNLRYYYAYLDKLVYLAYRHLFNLDWALRQIGFPRYWYNSVNAQQWLEFDRWVMFRGFNIVDYLSSCFSSFYYQFDKYHRVYDYRVVQLMDPRVLSKYHRHARSSTVWFHYYYAGCPILDLVSRLFDLRLLSDRPLNCLMREINAKWLSYLMNERNLLRMPELQFKMYFNHTRTEIEERMIKSHDWLNIVKLVGVPDDARAFGFCSTRLWIYTDGYSKHLLGLEDYFKQILAIRPYRLYSVNVARGELLTMDKLARLGL